MFLRPVNVYFVLGLEILFMSVRSACLCVLRIREGEDVGVKRA